MSVTQQLPRWRTIGGMAYLIIAAAASLIIIVNAVFASVPNYRVAPLFLIPLLGIVYLLRNALHISPLRYGLFASALLLHDLGAYGFYQQNPTPLSFDMYIHFYFAVVGTSILHGALRHHLPWRPWQVKLATLLFIMGLGACHEIMEFSTTLVLGEERGMLKKTGYRFDTERDLTCNLVGCIVTIIAITLMQRVRPPRTASADGRNPR